jgi:hypothetical protein
MMHSNVRLEVFVVSKIKRKVTHKHLLVDHVCRATDTKEEDTMKTRESVRQGGRNIFEDLKLPDGEGFNGKAQIA